MANYITNEVLSEAYTHLDIELFQDKEKLERLRKELTDFFSERARFLFGADLEIRVVFEEGSLKTKIIAVGSAAMIITSLASTYGSFRQGINQLSSDATSLAQAANLEVIFRTKTPYCDRLRIEKRRGVFGRVANLLMEFDGVRNRVEESRLPTTLTKLKDVTATVDELLDWDSSADTLFSKFDGPDTELCVAQGLLEEVKRLPHKMPWQTEIEEQSFRAQIATSDPNFAGNIAATAERYSVSLAAIKKKLQQRIDQATEELK